jgi:hypothetical protein
VTHGLHAQLALLDRAGEGVAMADVILQLDLLGRIDDLEVGRALLEKA